jgi:hypothetical protein
MYGRCVGYLPLSGAASMEVSALFFSATVGDLRCIVAFPFTCCDYRFEGPAPTVAATGSPCWWN